MVCFAREKNTFWGANHALQQSTSTRQGSGIWEMPSRQSNFAIQRNVFESPQDGPEKKKTRSSMVHWALDADPNDPNVPWPSAQSPPAFFPRRLVCCDPHNYVTQLVHESEPFATSKVGSKKPWPLKRYQKPKPSQNLRKKTTKLGISWAWAPWWCCMVYKCVQHLPKTKNLCGSLLVAVT